MPFSDAGVRREASRLISQAKQAWWGRVGRRIRGWAKNAQTEPGDFVLPAWRWRAAGVSLFRVAPWLGVVIRLRPSR